MAKTPIKPTRTLAPGTSPAMLTDDEKAQLRAKARERVEQERRDAAMDIFLQQEIELARRAYIPSQEMKLLFLNMAGHSDRIMIDGVVYFHGQTYEVPKSLYDVLNEVVARGWDHEDEIGGANRDVYRRPRSTALLPGMEGLSTSQIMGHR